MGAAHLDGAGRLFNKRFAPFPPALARRLQPLLGSENALAWPS